MIWHAYQDAAYTIPQVLLQPEYRHTHHYLFLSMQGTVEYSNNYGIIEKDEIDLNFFKKSQLIMNYDIYVKLNNNMILTTLCNPADNNAESVLMMKSNIITMMKKPWNVIKRF